MNQTNFFAYMLILIGTVLLLYQFDVIEFSRFEIITAASIFLGIVWLRKSMIHPAHKGVLGGTFWTLFGISLLLMRNYVLPMNDTFGFGLVFLLLAVANLASFIFSQKSMTNISFTLLFTLIGSGFFAVHYGVIKGWEMADIFIIYWPLLLVVGGIFLVIEGLMRRTG
jgi:hypothetical protein